MKKGLFIIIAVTYLSTVNAQNVGIGTAEPFNKLQVQGNFLVTTPVSSTNTSPTVAQTKSIINGATIHFLQSDSTLRIYDPGGPVGNYLPNLTGNVNLPISSNNIGWEITVESMQLGTGDSLIIRKSNISDNILLAVGNGYSGTGKWIINSNGLYITFKSNADANTGSGFSLLFKRLYEDNASLPGLTGMTGRSFLFDIKTGALRSGLISDATWGNYSVGMGLSVTASGFAATAFGSNTEATGSTSTAMGYSSLASGENSTAMGSRSLASGENSTAMGSYTEATGINSTAFGYSTNAVGSESTAMGYYTTASGTTSTAIGANNLAAGDNSFAAGRNSTAASDEAIAMGLNTTAAGTGTIALGSYVSTAGNPGCLVIGDRSTTTVLYSTTDNSFRARFDGGYRFFTSAAAITAESCLLASGSNAWSTTSDRRLKENFEPVNGESFLQKISAMPLSSWNYKSQNPATFRHYGPMAQDFFAAFGKDIYGVIGNDTTINSADFDGVNLIAIQALEKRTQKIAQLENENTLLKKELEAMKARLEKLEALLLKK